MAEIVEQADLEAHAIEEELADDTDKAAEEEIQAGIINVELNRDNLVKAFSLFAGKQKVSLVSLIRLLIPEVNGDQVSVTMTRQQEEFIGEIKIDWQAYLKQYFNNPAITLQFIIDETANTKRQAYTASEQFDEMLNEHELFRKMVNQFKLKLKQ